MHIRKVVGIAVVAMVLASSGCSAGIFAKPKFAAKRDVFNDSIKKLQGVQQAFLKNVDLSKAHYAALLKRWDGHLTVFHRLIQAEKKKSGLKKSSADQISRTYGLLAGKSKWLFDHVTDTENQAVFEQMKKNIAELYRAQGSVMNVRDKNGTEIKKALLTGLDLTVKMYGKVIDGATRSEKIFKRGSAI